MPDVRLIDANAIVWKLKSYYEALSPDVQSELIRRDEVSSCIAELINAPTIDAIQREKWNELKETIIEMRDSGGTATQKVACKFLTNLMEILEKEGKNDGSD